MARLQAVVAAAALMALCSCTPRYARFSGFAQGGTYTVTYNTKGVKASPAAVKAGVESILADIDTTLSGYNKASVLSRYNAGLRPELPGMFTDVLDRSEAVRESTSGALDVQAAALFDIWGFGFTGDRIPSDADVQEALAQRGRKLNFNAVAQGYSCDTVASYLNSLGVMDMLVDIGEIWCRGTNPSGEPWQIGIDNPVDGNDTPGADIRAVWTSDARMQGQGIVTSGNYRKFYVRDGRKYAHTIDPRTGYPVEHHLLSATVVAPTAFEADALATAFMVMGPECARDYTLSHPQVEAFLICADTTWASPGFAIRK